jgi:hypothetical protein
LLRGGLNGPDCPRPSLEFPENELNPWAIELDGQESANHRCGSRNTGDSSSDGHDPGLLSWLPAADYSDDLLAIPQNPSRSLLLAFLPGIAR